jgi:hypothetical protein
MFLGRSDFPSILDHGLHEPTNLSLLSHLSPLYLFKFQFWFVDTYLFYISIVLIYFVKLNVKIFPSHFKKLISRQPKQNTKSNPK